MGVGSSNVFLSVTLAFVSLFWFRHIVSYYYSLAIEDNSKRLQVVISPDLWHESRIILRDAKILIVEGWLYKEANAWTLRANKLWKLNTQISFTKYKWDSSND